MCSAHRSVQRTYMIDYGLGLCCRALLQTIGNCFPSLNHISDNEHQRAQCLIRDTSLKYDILAGWSHLWLSSCQLVLPPIATYFAPEYLSQYLWCCFRCLSSLRLPSTSSRLPLFQTIGYHYKVSRLPARWLPPLAIP